MKSIEMPSVNKLLKFAFLAVLLLAFSCSQEPAESEVNLEAANAKSKTVLKTLATGAALKAANGIDIGLDDNLYVASVLGQEIVVMNKETGAIIKRIGSDKGVVSPDDLVFSPNGEFLYWTDILTGEVGRLEIESGDFRKQIVDVNGGTNPIAFNDEGRLFVALDFLGDGLYELDPNLVNEPRPIVPNVPGTFPLGFFNSFDFGDNGLLFGPLFAAGLVISVDVDSENAPSSNPFADGVATVEAVIPPGPNGEAPNPAAAKFDGDGLLTVLDQLGRVWKIDLNDLDDPSDNGAPILFTTIEPGLDNMVFDTDGALYMTNNDEGWVAEVLISGQPRFLSPGGMIAPQGLAVLGGSVFVADQFSLRKFNRANGKQKNSYKGFLIPEEGSPSLVLPMNLSADGNNLVVSSWFSGAVQVWDPRANEVLENYPMGAPVDAIRFLDDIVVTDVGLGGSGLYWASDQSSIDLGVPLFAPSGLATDGETLWVADWATGDVWQVNFDNKAPNAVEKIATGLSFPEGLALDKEGGLLVVEMGTSSLSRIDLATGDVASVKEDLELSGFGPVGPFPPTWLFNGVDVTPSGDIYVSGAGAESNVIYRITNNNGQKAR